MQIRGLVVVTLLASTLPACSSRGTESAEASVVALSSETMFQSFVAIEKGHQPGIDKATAALSVKDYLTQLIANSSNESVTIDNYHFRDTRTLLEQSLDAMVKATSGYATVGDVYKALNVAAKAPTLATYRASLASLATQSDSSSGLSLAEPDAVTFDQLDASTRSADLPGQKSGCGDRATKASTSQGVDLNNIAVMWAFDPANGQRLLDKTRSELRANALSGQRTASSTIRYFNSAAFAKFMSECLEPLGRTEQVGTPSEDYTVD